MSLLAIDPGCPDCGCALYSTKSRLVAAAWSRIPDRKPARCPACRTSAECEHEQLPQSWVAMCDAIEEDMGLRDLQRPVHPQVVVTEFPQVFYRPERGKSGRAAVNAIGGGKHIMPLAVVAGMMLDRGRGWGARCFAFTPSQWKGTKRKDLFQCDILAQLLPEERELLPRLRTRDGRLVYRTDPLDAAGLGLVFLLRAGERRPVMYDAPARFMELVEKVEHE